MKSKSSIRMADADVNLRLLANAIAIALRDEPQKRDALLDLVSDIRSNLSMQPWTSPQVQNPRRGHKATQPTNIGKPVITIARDDRQGA